MKAIFTVVVILFAICSLPSCTPGGGIDTSNPAVQSAISDAETVAANELSALLNQHLHGRHADVTIKDPIVVGAIMSAETKIRRKHPEMSAAKAHSIAVRAAKAKIGVTP